MFDLETAKANVERGIALLDEKVPGWRSILNLSILDLSCGCNCILGQVSGTFDRGVEEFLGIGRKRTNWAEWVRGDSHRAIVSHGFSIPYEDGNDDDLEEWSALQQAWLALLQEL